MKYLWLLAVVFLGGYIVHQSLGKPDKPYHLSYFSEKDFFDTAYAGQTGTSPSPMPKGILVNHHLLAKQYIAEAFRTIENAPGEPVVVLLSPNHFGVGNGQITTTDYNWKTPYGVLGANQSVIARLASMDEVRIDPRPFAKEHGVSGIVPFIKKSLPNATVVPVLFKSTLSFERVIETAKGLQRILPTNSLIVASVDMSHYMSEDIALPQDKETIEALGAGDLGALWLREVDSPASLVTIGYLMQQMDKQFTLLQRSSSHSLTGLREAELNTSYITGYWN